MEGNMSKTRLSTPADFPVLLNEIKNRIQCAQTRAMLSVNAELIQLYWDIGRIIAGRQQQEGWDAAVIPRLARELANELPEEKGFSERNIKRMLAFYREYPDPAEFVPQVAAQLESGDNVPQPAALLSVSLLWSIPWFHHIVLIENVKDQATRHWYMRQTLTSGWSRNVLLAMIQSEAHARQGQALTNQMRCDFFCSPSSVEAL
jgi:predicted nuclease of restriction endonuclease-like (RecB) superfamily